MLAFNLLGFLLLYALLRGHGAGAAGPRLSQEAIKQLGSNGGGFFSVNSAHRYENPTPLANFVEMIFLLLFAAGLGVAYLAELEGKEVRFGIVNPVLWAQFGLFGEPRVSVLLLNLALDERLPGDRLSSR